MQKSFIWNDKSGRGFRNPDMSLEQILQLENEGEDDEESGDESLHTWARNAEEGDVWEDAANRYECNVA